MFVTEATRFTVHVAIPTVQQEFSTRTSKELIDENWLKIGNMSSSENILQKSFEDLLWIN